MNPFSSALLADGGFEALCGMNQARSRTASPCHFVFQCSRTSVLEARPALGPSPGAANASHRAVVGQVIGTGDCLCADEVEARGLAKCDASTAGKPAAAIPSQARVRFLLGLTGIKRGEGVA